MGWTLNPLATSDGIVDVYKPFMVFNVEQIESVGELLYRLLATTKSYLRVRANHVFDIIYPQTGDSVDRTWYSYQIPYFNEYLEKINVLIPNTINVLCNKTTPASDPNWQTDTTTIIVGTATDSAQVEKYGEILDVYTEPLINNQADANNLAGAILTRIQAEMMAGQLLIPHDAGLELHDGLSVVDTRGI